MSDLRGILGLGGDSGDEFINSSFETGMADPGHPDWRDSKQEVSRREYELHSSFKNVELE